MPFVGVKVVGANELRSLLRQAADASPKQMTTANKDAAGVVAADAQRNAPRRSGRLASSIRATATQRAGNVKAGGARVPYAAAIHWGRKIGNVGSPPGNHKGRNPIAGRPFLTDALRRQTIRVVRTYEKAVDEILRSLKG